MDILMQNKLLFRLSVILAALNLALLVFFGWKFFYGDSKKPGKHISHTELAMLLKKELGLNEMQADSLKNIRLSFFEKEKILSEATRAKRDSMNELMYSPGKNDSTLKALAAGVAANEYQMELLRIEQSAQLQSICNPEQIKKLERLVREIRDYLKPDDRQMENEKSNYEK